MAEKTVRIGGASGYWGESAIATPQLLKSAGLNYLVYDYLAEITMSIMARARASDPARGFATDFVSAVLQPNLEEIWRLGVKVISNAGGVNPLACADLVRQLIKEHNLDLKVAVVTGDDLLDRIEEFTQSGMEDLYSGRPLPPPDEVASINAYLGAFPIAEALRQGADIVITGRCVDSAVTLGACIHEFGWGPHELDKLAGGSLAGHILECGPQATGGNFTDWERVADTIHNIGYPIAEISADGSFITTKPADTGGEVTIGTVSEQMVYEIGDPQAYILPDVVCDFSRVTLSQESENRVRLCGARGYPPPDRYKVSLTAQDGFRGGTIMTFYGADAEKKANTYAEAAFKRARQALEQTNSGDYSEISVEIIGAESQFGHFRQIEKPREVAMKVAAKHPDAAGISILLRELTGLGLATPPGLSGFAGARSKPMPLLRLYSILVPKDKVHIELNDGARSTAFKDAAGMAHAGASVERPPQPAPVEQSDLVQVPLISLAWGRSGDKGNKANIGIIARDPSYISFIWAALSEEVVADRFAHFLEAPGATSVERYFLPGCHAINFLLHDVLGGGGIASIRNDPQGKGYAQLLLATPVPVSCQIAEALQ